MPWGWLVLLACAGLGGWLAYEYLSLPSTAEIAKLAGTRVSETPLMRTRVDEAVAAGRKLVLRRRWVEYDQLAPSLVTAVISSEDARFFAHDGLDFVEIQAALQDGVERKRWRGASTLTQQLAKNLFLSADRSLLRKLKEAVLVGRIEEALDKRRILTLYLNVAEWGDGVFGAEAAARAWFNTSARELKLYQAATLAAMLPNPRRIDPLHPEALRHRALHVLDRIEEDRRASAEEVAVARDQLDRWLLGRGH